MNGDNSPSPPLNRRIRHHVNRRAAPSNRVVQNSKANNAGQQQQAQALPQFGRANQQGSSLRSANASGNNPQASIDEQDSVEAPMNLLQDDSDCESSSFERMRLVSGNDDIEHNDDDDDVDEPDELDDDQQQPVAIFYEETERGTPGCSRRCAL